MRLHDLLVLFKGNISQDHVVQQDAQGPHGHGAAVVAMVTDPLRRAIDTSSWNKIHSPLHAVTMYT